MTAADEPGNDAGEPTAPDVATPDATLPEAPAPDPDPVPAAPPASNRPVFVTKPRKPLRPWQYILIGAAIPIVLLVALGMLLPLLLQAAMPGGMMPGQQEYTVSKTQLSQQVTVPGTIEPTQRLNLSFSSTGDVTHVGVAVGDPVTPGTVLARIDDTELRAAVSDASAEADAAWKDYQDARKSGSSAAVSAMRSAHALKAQALKDARAALDKSTLTSTIDGVVAAVNVRQGDRAGGGGGGGAPDTGGMPGVPGMPGGLGVPSSADASGADVVVISRTFQVKASVGAAERNRITKGMAATVRSASSQAPLKGTVTALGVVAEQTPGDRPSAATFPLVVTLEGQPTDVFAGSAATIEVETERGREVLAIPQTALLMRESETKGTVMVKRGDKPEPVDVTLGASAGELVEVVSGLNEGDVVVIISIPGGPGGAMGGPAPASEGPKR